MRQEHCPPRSDEERERERRGFSVPVGNKNRSMTIESAIHCRTQ